MAAKDKKKDKKGRAPAAPADSRPRLSGHPRARRQIREAKAWSGLVGFALVFVLSLEGGSLLFDAGIRALAAGAGCYVAAWGVAVLIWSQIARAEVLVAEERYRESAERGMSASDVRRTRTQQT